MRTAQREQCNDFNSMCYKDYLAVIQLRNTRKSHRTTFFGEHIASRAIALLHRTTSYH